MSDIEPHGRRGSGLRPFHGVVAVVVGVVGVLLAFWVLTALAGFLWGLVKLAVVAAVVVGIVWLLVRRR